jgi:diguanylate cyclase (GGDEF)-like protein
MCRARLHLNQAQAAEGLKDALAATALFEGACEPGLALDAVSFAVASASVAGQLALAAEMATKAVLGLDSAGDDSLIANVANRLGNFCYEFLDYDRAVLQFEAGLAAAERAGDREKVCMELYNIADALLRANRASRAKLRPSGTGPDQVERARRALQRLLEEAAQGLQLAFSVEGLRAEVLFETGHPLEALGVIDRALRGAGLVQDIQKVDFPLVESRCLRALGRDRAAAEAAERAVEVARAGRNHQDLMLALEERMTARQAVGDLEGALADAAEAKSLMMALYQRQTSQIAEQVWERAALERERRQLEQQAAAATLSAEEDALTGIGNRRRLKRFLDDVAETPATLALVMADIDLFKEINDTFGHELGDMVLRALGELLAAEARSGQVVVRYGGEEFVFAMPGAELAAAASFAERTRSAVASYPWAELDARLAVTISLGVSSGRSDEWPSVLAEADSALYLAKRRGRNRVEVANRALEQAAG